jgi:hypothetical protein
MHPNQHQVSYQNFTLLTAFSAGNEWTIAEVNKLKSMRDSGVSVAEIAQTLGRTYYAVQTFLGANGLTKARQTTPAPKVEACPSCFLTHSYECEM